MGRWVGRWVGGGMGGWGGGRFLPAGEHVTDVDEEGAWDRVREDPFALGCVGLVW